MVQFVIHKYINIKRANSKPFPYISPYIHKSNPVKKRKGVNGTRGIRIISPKIAIIKNIGSVTN